MAVTDSDTNLAVLGGTPVCRRALPAYPSMGAREVAAVQRVVESGCLSGFSGAWDSEYYGGPEVKELEAAWSRRFQVRHSVSVNSATSGLLAAVGAARVGPGDEVILPPYTMSATAMAPLVYGAIPVFADITADDFCLDLEAVRRAISTRTKAIIAVNLFGHPACLSELAALARQHGLVLIEDNAQAPLATENGHLTGTIGDIGVFSLNRHKHIHAGEGGICVTNDDDLAQRLQLIRNHGENAVEPLGIADMTNLVGFNLRLTELAAAVAVEQLRDIDRHVAQRVRVAQQLTSALSDLEGIIPPQAREGCTHVYYMWPFRYREAIVGVSRETFGAALRAEGIPNVVGYVEPLYLLPLFRQRVAIGRDGFPFNLGSQEYGRGLCPVAERMHDAELMLFEVCAYDLTDEFVDVIVRGVRKVHRERHALREVAPDLRVPHERVAPGP